MLTLNSKSETLNLKQILSQKFETNFKSDVSNL